MNQLLHTPEGVRDIYKEECRKKIFLQKCLQKTLHRYGYEDIVTPTFEFFDVFSSEVGTVSSKELYKFFDREGNTLVLRPDFTPSIARAASKYLLSEDKSVRLCYTGNAFINNANFQGRLKETTQIGAEFMGDASVDSDAEMIAMVVEAMLSCGLQEFQVSIGHVSFFKGLLKEAMFDKETELAVRENVSGKNFFAVEEMMTAREINASLKEAFQQLPLLFGGIDILDKAEKYAFNSEIEDSINRLRRLYDILKIYGYEKYISFDLGIVSKYQYYTGITFRAYTYGVGEAVAKGGRYDTLLEHFGVDAPAVGFVVVVDMLLAAINRQNIPIDISRPITELHYNDETREEVITRAKVLRLNGQGVKLIYEGEV